MTWLPWSQPRGARMQSAASAETVDTDHLGHGNYQLGNGKMFEGKKYLTGGAGGVLSLFCDLDSGDWRTGGRAAPRGMANTFNENLTSHFLITIEKKFRLEKAPR